MPRPNFITENAKMKKMGFSLQTGGVHSNLWPKIHPKATSFQQNYLVLTNVRRGCVKKQSLDVTNRFSSCIWLVETMWMLKQCKLLSSSTATRFFDYTGKFIDNQWGSIRHKATQWREKQTGIHMYIMCILRTYIYYIYMYNYIYSCGWFQEPANLETMMVHRLLSEEMKTKLLGYPEDSWSQVHMCIFSTFSVRFDLNDFTGVWVHIAPKHPWPRLDCLRSGKWDPPGPLPPCLAIPTFDSNWIGHPTWWPFMG